MRHLIHKGAGRVGIVHPHPEVGVHRVGVEIGGVVLSGATERGRVGGQGTIVLSFALVCHCLFRQVMVNVLRDDIPSASRATRGQSPEAIVPAVWDITFSGIADCK